MENTDVYRDELKFGTGTAPTVAFLTPIWGLRTFFSGLFSLGTCTRLCMNIPPMLFSLQSSKGFISFSKTGHGVFEDFSKAKLKQKNRPTPRPEPHPPRAPAPPGQAPQREAGLPGTSSRHQRRSRRSGPASRALPGRLARTPACALGLPGEAPRLGARPRCPGNR